MRVYFMDGPHMWIWFSENNEQTMFSMKAYSILFPSHGLWAIRTAKKRRRLLCGWNDATM